MSYQVLHVVLWKWDQPNFRVKYTSEHVNIVAQMVERNVKRRPVRVHCITDAPEGIDPKVKVHKLWNDFNDVANATGNNLPSCYRRLKLFDIATQAQLGIAAGDRVCSLDLDSIVLNSLDDLFDRIDETKAPYAGWGVPGHHHMTVFNGSFWTFVAGNPALQYVWSSFDPKESPKIALRLGFLGSDQAWLSMHMTKDDQSCPIRFPDFASYPREVRRTKVLDRRTKIVFFHGARKPWFVEEMRSNPWITRAWRLDQ